MSNFFKNTRNKNILVGLIMILVTLPFLFETRLSNDPLYLTPYIAIATMILSGVFVICDGIKKANGEKEDNRPASLKSGEVIGIILFLLVSAFLLDKIGFYITLSIIVFTINIYLDKRNHGQIRWVKALIFTAVTIGVTYFVFGSLLSIRVPDDVLLF